MKLYCNVDQEGNITESIGGVDGIIPEKSYEYDFDVSADVLTTIHLYKVENGVLIKKEVV